MRSLGRLLTTTTASAALLVAAVVPAWAHASFDIAKAQVDTKVELTLLAPLERDSTNSRIEALFPAGFTVLSCEGPTAWFCDTSPSGGGTLVTWETLAVTQTDIAFDVEVRTPKTAGARRIPVIQTYTDGHEAAWVGDGGAEPAPVIEITSTATAPTKNTAPPVDHGTDAGSGSNGSGTGGNSSGGASGSGDDAGEATGDSSSAGGGGGSDGASDADTGDASASTDEPAAGATEATADGGASEVATEAVQEQATTAPVVPDDGASEAPTLAVTPAAERGSSGLAVVALMLLLAAAGGAAWWWRTQQTTTS